LRNRRKDHRCYAIRILHHLGIPKPKYRPTRRFEITRPRSIGFDLRCMMSTVAFDRDLYRAACQIDDEMTDNKLPGEAGAACP
jgi:hypothetical protein